MSTLDSLQLERDFILGRLPVLEDEIRKCACEALHSLGKPALTAREREVLPLIVGGLCNKEIAWKLHVSERTVKFYVSSLLRKYGACDRHQLEKIVTAMEKL